MVCAYARVSTEKEEQEDSFERQVSHYTEYINSRYEWEFGGIYADPGISGTQAEKRDDFMRMIGDCRIHKIDKILVKSVSRFARNTVDALRYIRELKEIGISVFFENENIDTMTPGGEVLITILAAMAEQESRNISTNIKWAYQKKFKNGDVALNYTRFLGYTRNDKHELVIVPHEAKIVKRIYREYLSGYSSPQIARGLMEDAVPTPSNKKVWKSKVIMSIIQNEKYKGDNLAGKTFKPDVLSPKRIKNEGQVTAYYHENSHPAIIPKETFEMVQAEIKRRNELRSCSETGSGKFSSKYPFSTILICTHCGTRLRRHGHYLNGEFVPKWVCMRHQKSSQECPMPPIKEDTIKALYLEALKHMVGNMEEFKNTLSKNIESSLENIQSIELEEIARNIEIKQSEMLELNREKRAGIISEMEYLERGSQLGEKMDLLNEQSEKLQAKNDTAKLEKYRLEEIINVLEIVNLEEFNENIFKSIILKMLEISPKEIEFEFKCGIKITEKLK